MNKKILDAAREYAQIDKYKTGTLERAHAQGQYEGFLAGALEMNEAAAKECQDYDCSDWAQPYIDCNEIFAGRVHDLLTD